MSENYNTYLETVLATSATASAVMDERWSVELVSGDNKIGVYDYSRERISQQLQPNVFAYRFYQAKSYLGNRRGRYSSGGKHNAINFSVYYSAKTHQPLSTPAEMEEARKVAAQELEERLKHKADPK